MAITTQEAQKHGAELCALDLNNEQHQTRYKQILFRFISANEGILSKSDEEANPQLKIYKDINGHPTIGYGFNMEGAGAKMYWANVVGETPRFEDVKNGEASITKSQALELFWHVRNTHKQILKNYYQSAFDKLPVYVQLVMEDLYYNTGGRIVGKGTNFYNNILKYSSTRDIKYLTFAAKAIDNYYSVLAKGAQNRGKIQKMMLLQNVKAL